MATFIEDDRPRSGNGGNAPRLDWRNNAPNANRDRRYQGNNPRGNGPSNHNNGNGGGDGPLRDQVYDWMHDRDTTNDAKLIAAVIIQQNILLKKILVQVTDVADAFLAGNNPLNRQSDQDTPDGDLTDPAPVVQENNPV